MQSTKKIGILYLDTLYLCAEKTHHFYSTIRVECGIFFIGQNRSTNQRSGMILEVQIQNFGARSTCSPKFSFSKNSRGLKIPIFFVKIGMKLPFTIKNKGIHTNLRFAFKNYFIFIPEKASFWFLKKNTQNKFSLLVSALIQF